ncbi:MAG TPA: hypothetical protein EYP51_11865, partial [Thiotrichales bacterium]|nr:hypothetical protein [Thiotrichales bacterium]
MQVSQSSIQSGAILSSKDYAEMLSAVTEWDITSKELEIVGERIWNAERAFNILSFGDGRAY